MQYEYLLRLENINKSFFDVRVLKDVKFEVMPGEVHALTGENGAGKSTLMKILAGIYNMDSGEIWLDGERVEINSPDDARDLGITIIHQEICLVPQFSIAENIFLGRELENYRGFINKPAMRRKAQQVLDDLELKLSADMTLDRLSIAQQQMVEIAKALSFNAKIIVMDEPTAALTETEVDHLMAEIKKLKGRGVTIIYISHRMQEIYRVCDRCTVLRDGDYIGTADLPETPLAEIIRMMVGRNIDDIYGAERRIHGGDEIVMEVRNLRNRCLKDISFALKKGEILGFAGLVGAGRTELARAVFGIDKLDSGELYLNGEKTEIKNPQQAINKGLALLPEDRKDYGLILSNTVAFNLTLPVISQFIKWIYVNRNKEREIIDEYAYKLSIRMTGPWQICQSLSGGNQQKVVISKCLASEPDILILDEPTRGIDVGAKSEMYRIIKDLAEKGISIIFISSELPEIIQLSSRICVMYEGELMTVIPEDEVEGITQEKIMFYAMGGFS